MRKRNIIGGILLAAQSMGTVAAFAGPWEDGMAAYNRGDYMPAIRLFRPLAEQGNAKAQNVLGVMFRKGEGVAKSPARAHMWFSLAAKRGEAGARAELRDMSRTMTPREIS
jgi:TPR repeat protein